jgi:hypothetical protein
VLAHRSLQTVALTVSPDAGESVDTISDSTDGAGSTFERKFSTAGASDDTISDSPDGAPASVSSVLLRSTSLLMLASFFDTISDSQDGASSSLNRDFSVTLINFASDIGKFC